MIRYNNLLFEVTKDYYLIKINRPKNLNALNQDTIKELKSCFDYIDNNLKNKYGVIITGEGDKSFVAGADIKEFTQLDNDSSLKFCKNGHDLFNKIERMPIPVIALVNGYALGGGCELSLACHLRIATKNAQFSQPEINLGLIPGYGGTQRLSQIVGKSKALEIMLTANMISAQKAYEYNIVNDLAKNYNEALKQIYPNRYVPNRLAELVCEHKVTFSHCVPTILHMLLDSDAAASADLSNWKLIIGGSALSRGLAERALAKGINLFSAYGLSETCPLLTVAQLDPNDEDNLDARLKAGRPAAMVELRVIDDAMNDVIRDGNSVGEVVARAPWLTQSYLKDEDATTELWRGGYLHTGDVGRFDEEGGLIITDRLKDVIKSGGEWISSLTLESIASTVPGVTEVAAISIPDLRWGERPMLLVVKDSHRKNNVQEMIKIAFSEAVAAGVIPKWATPDRIDFVDEIAKTSVGKIDKKKLRAISQKVG